ncbi:MAG: glycerophosphodiester phosphodiesterase family protein [Muribaculaceae bacterium]
MLKNFSRLGITCGIAIVAFSSCENQDFTNENVDVTKVQVNQISPEMAKVRDYVPKFAVMAHRGSTFWTPEETEAAYRWAREMGADYLEADLQCTKDGVILALHDDNLRRTTNIENIYGEDVPRERKAYYMRHGMTDAEAEAQYVKDRAGFTPYYANSYMYEELVKLDAGAWFNQTSIEQARPGFVNQHQYISPLEDLIMYAKGNKLKRNANGERVFTVTGSSKDKSIKYHFEYIADNVDRGNRPGIYIEFKESWLNPSTFETDVYNELDRLNFNIITKPESPTAPFYLNGKVNVGNTNGKVVLQTFSLESLRRSADKFQGKIPMCFLLWQGGGATDLKLNTPAGYASFVNLGVEFKAHIIGPSIAGAPNNYPEMVNPWQDYLIKKSGLLNHPYSFDSREQMNKYFGLYNFGINGGQLFNPPYLDGAFTNRSEMTIQFFIDQKVRKAPAPQTVPDPEKLLTELGY